MTTRIDHANLTVRDVDGLTRFLQAALPEFVVRGEGRNRDGSRWLHVGNDQAYIALNEATRDLDRVHVPYEGVPGTNHVGWEVEDAQAVRDRLLAAGYRESTPPNDHPYRRRVYFYDAEGHDWEFVEYRTDDPAKRNDYSDANG